MPSFALEYCVFLLLSNNMHFFDNETEFQNIFVVYAWCTESFHLPRQMFVPSSLVSTNSVLCPASSQNVQSVENYLLLHALALLIVDKNLFFV